MLKRFLIKRGVLYAPQNTFHDLSRLKEMLSYTYDSLVTGTWDSSWEQRMKAAGITFEGRTSYGNPVADLVTMSYEEWLQAKGGLSKCLWAKFLEIIEVSENLPEPDFDNEKVRKELSTSWWDFRHIFPGFVFATSEQEQEDCIMAMNPVATTDPKYLGTMEEVIAMYGALPMTCIFIANNCTPSQQIELLQIVGKSYVVNDGQGGVASLKDHYWRIMVM